MRSHFPAILLGAVLLSLLLASCEWREVQRRNELPQCVQENAGPRIDVFPRLEEVEANLLATGALPDVTRDSYRALLDSLYDASLSGGTLPVTRAALCRDVADCDRLVRPAVNVAYPHCYREIAKHHELSDSTGFWAQQNEIWGNFFRAGDWSKERTLRALDATPAEDFKEFEVRAFYAQHVLYLIDRSSDATSDAASE